MDYGEKRIGVAVSDPLQMFAKPLAVLPSGDDFFGEFAKILAEFRCERMVVGMPYDAEGERTQKCAQVEMFARELRAKFALPMEFYDESFSSVEARAKLAKKGVSDQQVKGKLDMYAAAEILDRFLDSKR